MICPATHRALAKPKVIARFSLVSQTTEPNDHELSTSIFLASIVAAVVGALCAVANPALFACSRETEGYQFNDTDMAAAVEGDYTGSVEGKAISVHLERADQSDHTGTPLQRAVGAGQERTLQCGSRSFIKTASACLSTSTMSIKAIVTSESDVTPSRVLSGWFTVWGNNLSSGDLTFDDEAKHVLDATFRDGVLRDWTLSNSDGTTFAIDLTRVE